MFQGFLGVSIASLPALQFDLTIPDTKLGFSVLRLGR